MAATTRINATAFTTPSDREIVMMRVFDAPRSRVFEVWTNPKHLPQWLLGPEGWTMSVCDIDLRVGGAWHFAWRHLDGTAMEMHGVYQEIVPPERLVFTESWGGVWPETLTTLILTEEHCRTTATCVSGPSEIGWRCRTSDRDERWHVRQFQSSRRVSAHEGR